MRSPSSTERLASTWDDDELARLAQFVFVPINLNTASDDDILSIPGVGPRLLHEFKEYRPYPRIEQFRREIGKYVSDDDVARLERYVTLDELSLGSLGRSDFGDCMSRHLGLLHIRYARLDSTRHGRRGPHLGAQVTDLSFLFVA